MRTTWWPIVLLLTFSARPAGAGPERPIVPPSSLRTVEPAPPVRPERPRALPQPEPPPPELLPGPLSREDQRRFDRLRIQGIHLYEEGRYPEAATYFREALRLKPHDPVTQGWLRAAEDRGR